MAKTGKLNSEKASSPAQTAKKPRAKRPAVKEFPHRIFVTPLASFNWMDWSASSAPADLINKVKSWAYVCVERNATACAQTPLRLYRVKRSGGYAERAFNYKTAPVDKKKNEILRVKTAERTDSGAEFEEVLEHPILDLLRQVNRWQNAFDLKLLTFRYLETLGKAFWYLEKAPTGQIINIWILAGQNVKVVPDATNGVKHFEYQTGAEKIIFQTDDIVYFHNPSLAGFWDADSPLKAAEQAIDLYDAMNRLEINTFRKGGRPDVVLEIPSDGFIDEEEKRRIEQEYARKFNGLDNQGKLIITSGGAQIKPFGFAPREMNYLQGRKAALEEICGAFGVPLSFVLIQEISRANAYASLEMWMKYTISPRLTMVEQKLNEQFTPKYGEELFLLFDNPEPTDAEQRLKEIQTRLSTGLTTINEERAVEGFEPVEWGDLPLSLQSTRLDTIQPEQTPEQEEREEGNEQQGIRDIQARQKGARFGEGFAPKDELVVRIMRAQLAILFKRWQAETAKRYEEYADSLAADKGADYLTKQNDKDILSSIVNLSDWGRQIEVELTPYLKGVLVNAMADAAEQINPNAVINASSPNVIKAIEKRRPTFSGISQTVAKRIQKQIREGIEAGEGAAAIAKRIRSSFDAAYEAERVARSELIWAHNEGAQIAWQQSGVVEAKEWNAATDDRMCELCQSMHGKRVSIDGKFFGKGDTLTLPSGAAITFDFSDIEHPPLHPNCRCSLIPVIRED